MMTPTEVRQLLGELDLRPSKALGQNFLIDGNVLEIIVREADIRSHETVLEIGPGLGALTVKLADRAAQVIAIEKDGRLAAFIRQRYPEVELIHGDAGKVDLPAAIKLWRTCRTASRRRFSNGSSKCAMPPRWLVLTVQKEVGLRLAAKPRQKDYGALTLFTQLRYHVTIVHIVSPRCFFPAAMWTARSSRSTGAIRACTWKTARRFTSPSDTVSNNAARCSGSWSAPMSGWTPRWRLSARSRRRGRRN